MGQTRLPVSSNFTSDLNRRHFFLPTSKQRWTLSEQLPRARDWKTDDHPSRHWKPESVCFASPSIPIVSCSLAAVEMVSKKSSRGPVSKISSAATPAAAAATQTVQKSSVLHSAFSPTEFQLALFASVIQSFDSQHLRVHDTNSGRLRCEHALGPKTKVHSLDWGVFGPKHRQPQSKKKRKRSEDTNGFPEQGAGQDAVVALATSDSDVKLFSPAESRITGTLSGGHERGVRSFRFTERKPSEGWSIGFDGKLVQWDCHSGQPIRSVYLVSILDPG